MIAEQDMLRKFPSRRLIEFGALPASDMKLLDQFSEVVRRYPRKTVIRSEGDAPDAIYLLQEGWVSSSLSSPDGRHHIVKLHLPGDMLGVASICLTEAADTLTTVTPASFRKLSVRHLAQIFASSPTFAASMFLIAQLERVMLTDRLHACATRSSLGKLATFLTDLHARLTALGMAHGMTFPLPLTQQQMGHFVGLSTIQVHRAMNELQSRGMIERHSNSVTILDLDALFEHGSLPARVADLDVRDRFAGASGE